MMRRCGILLLLALWVGGSGCAGTTLRPDGSSIFGPRAWNETPAPPQRTVAVGPTQPAAPVESAAKPEGLAKYFPGLQRHPAEPTKVAARYRPSWFGLRPRGNLNETQTYTTDARAGLSNRFGPEPTALPVALQVPTERRSSDRAVTPTNAETASPDSPTSAPMGTDPLATVPQNVTTSSATSPPVFGSSAPRPGEDEVRPQPPADGPGTTAETANRMPEVPAGDPRERPRLSNPRPASGAVASSDEKAVQALTPRNDPSRPPGLPEPTLPASYSPQAPAPSTPPAQAAPTTAVETSRIQAAPTVLASPQVSPTSQIKPSPQSECTCTCHDKTWKRPCLRRLVRKVCKLGEYATPPTAAPH